MRLLPAARLPFRSLVRLRRALRAGAVAILLCGTFGALAAAAQSSESTVRDVLIASGFPESLLTALPPVLLDQPASVLAGDDTAQLAAFLAQLQADGGNVDTSGANCQLALGAAYSGLWLASILEPPPLVTADWAAFTANLNLKRCAPVLRAPPDLGLEPDTPNACVRTVHNQRTQERASKIFFVDAASRDPNWGPLGSPTTDHYNSGMATSIQQIRRERGLSAFYQNQWDPFYADDAPENPAARSDLQLPLGRNVVTWRAGALADLLDFIWLPLPGIPAGWKAPFAKNIKNAALRALFETGVDFAAQLTRDVGSDKFGDYLRDYPTDSAVTVKQFVDVYDRVPPVITTSQTAFSFEGTILGGASIRTAPYRAALENALTYADNCENDAELIPPPIALWPVDQTTPVTWTVLDAGPNPDSPRADRRNSASVTQLVTVVDTLAPVIRPPEGVIRESASPVAIALQAPQIFDFVDAAPAVANDAPATFPLGTTPVTWTVTDQSGNAASAVQYVAVKAPGTNTAPTAQPLAASAESFTTTPIVVTGADADLDSLLFRIEQPPENGFFVAPLFPYFVGDLRQQGLQGLPNNGCGRDPSTIYEPEYVAIDDDERSYVLNAPVNCIQFTPQSRITVLDRDGNFVVGRDLPKSQNLYGLWIDPDERFIAYTHFELIGPFETYNVVSKIDLDTLETLVEIRLPLNQGSQKSVFDAQGFLYSTTSAPNGEVVVYDLRDRAPVDGRIEIDAADEIAAYTLTPEGSVVPASDIAIDSQRNLYVSSFQRIFKFAPVVRADDGPDAVVPGALIGWMGGCKGGTACDLARGISRGYTCTDATCTPLVGGLDPSGAPGQFLGLAGIALDPNDNLYVADSVNARVQRFTPEGYFAGQARTSCSDDESCFVRSEFSVPRAVSVNSKRFHVLDTTLDVLYMFDTSVVEPLRNPTTNLVDSARLLYQSNSGFTGTDHFRFVAGDGLAESAPAEVSVSVSRGFHPPEARDSHASFLRWVRKDIELVGLDPDFPFDTLTYTIESPPLHGWLSGEGATRTYWVDPDFVGVDSFTFRVSDGVTESEPARVTIDVIDSNVAAQPVSPGAVLHAGLGYPLLLSVPFADQNRQGTYGGLVEWGDGIVEDSNTGSIEVIGGGSSGVVSGAHRYASNGTFRLVACVKDGAFPSDVPIFTACANPRTDVVVEPMTDLRVGILDDNGPAPVGGALHYSIRVDHLAPDPTITTGIAAHGIAAEIVLAPNLGFAELPAGLGCTTGVRVVDGVDVATCPLPPLAPGAFAELPIVLRPRAATVDQAAWTVEIVSATPDPQAPNIALAVPRVIADPADRDALRLGGVATGGERITLTLAGQTISLFSIAGETGADVAARLASAIQQDVVLTGIGVTAQANGSQLATNVQIEAFDSEDAGLFEGQLVGFEGARLSIDLDSLGSFETQFASGTVVMAPSGRFSILPAALGITGGPSAPPSIADTVIASSALDASHDAGLFEASDGGTIEGRMPLAGTLTVELLDVPELFERALDPVGVDFQSPSWPFGWDVQVLSDVWTTGSIEVQRYSPAHGFVGEPVETFSGMDARGESPDTGTIALVAPLEIEVRKDAGLRERVPGFAELRMQFIPEPDAGLGAAVALLGLVWLSRRGPSRAGPSRLPRTHRRARRPSREATAPGPGRG